MSDLFRPGDAHVPTFMPYCRLCDQPVESYAVHDVTNPYYLTIDGQCCGRAQGMRLKVEELRQVLASNAKVWMVVKKGQYQGIGEMTPDQRRPKKPAQRKYVAIPRKVWEQTRGRI